MNPMSLVSRNKGMHLEVHSGLSISRLYGAAPGKAGTDGVKATEPGHALLCIFKCSVAKEVSNRYPLKVGQPAKPGAMTLGEGLA